MDVWEYEIISRVEQDISLVRFAHLWDILVNTQTFRKIHGKKREKFWIFKLFTHLTLVANLYISLA